MPRPSEAVYPRCTRASATGVSLLFGFLSILFVGCGISLSADHSQTELFKRLVVVGSLTPGAELRFGLNYEQPYSTGITIQCDLLTTAKATPPPEPTDDPLGTPTPTPVHVPAPIPTPGNLISTVLVQTIAPNPAGTTADESTPVPGETSRKFTAPDKPGRYTLRCYTPADRNNQIIRSFRIK